MVFLRYSIIIYIYIYYNRIKCLFYLLNVMNNLIAILRFCDFAILRYCDYFIYHPFNISSFPTSLKTIFPIPFAISQIYRESWEKVHRPERVNHCSQAMTRQLASERLSSRVMQASVALSMPMAASTTSRVSR